jgi:hypothetical protein
LLASRLLSACARLAAKFGPEITLDELTARFSYDCLWRAEARSKRGVSSCGDYLPDLDHCLIRLKSALQRRAPRLSGRGPEGHEAAAPKLRTAELPELQRANRSLPPLQQLIEALDTLAFQNRAKLRVGSIARREAFAIFATQGSDEGIGPFLPNLAVMVAHAAVETGRIVFGHNLSLLKSGDRQTHRIAP